MDRASDTPTGLDDYLEWHFRHSDHARVGRAYAAWRFTQARVVQLARDSAPGGKLAEALDLEVRFRAAFESLVAVAT